MKKMIFARSKTGGAYKYDICVGDPADSDKAKKIGSYNAGKPPRNVELDHTAYEKAIKEGYKPTQTMRSVVRLAPR